LSSWRRRTCCDAAELDRRVARVTVVDPHHPLYGGCFPVSDRRSGRGPELIVVRLPDGRERSISRSVTDLGRGSDGRPGSGGALISVRTLLPLANHVRVVLASGNAGLEEGRGRSGQGPMGPGGDRIGRCAGDAAAAVAATSGRDAPSAGAACGTPRATLAAPVRSIRGERAC
jgi:hypothetical protein